MNFTLFRQTAIALAMGLAGAAASAALPSFTFNPAAAGLAGTSFTADNILISDYSTVTLSGTSFTETGFLAVSGFQNAGTALTPTGLNSTYGMYFAFTGTGTTTTGDLGATPTFGSFNSLTYTLYGYNGPASFGFSGNTAVETATGEVALATGTLVSGSVVTVPGGDGVSFTPSANAKLVFNVAPAAQGFFQTPSPFYGTALTAFTNTSSQVEPFSGGFRILQGGGSVNFATPVPEPETPALLLAGLGVLGFVARRRKQQA